MHEQVATVKANGHSIILCIAGGGRVTTSPERTAGANAPKRESQGGEVNDVAPWTM